MPSVAFCTCTDHAYPNHPTNHDRGCTPCIAKCLSQHEIPTCFFRDVSLDLKPGDEQDWTYRGFAEHVRAHLAEDDA